MPSEVLNIGKIMRQEGKCYWRTLQPRETTLNEDEEVVVLKVEHSDFKVSKGAVQEEMRFIEALIELHINGIREKLLEKWKKKCKKNKNAHLRTTILEEDIIQINGYKDLL